MKTCPKHPDVELDQSKTHGRRCRKCNVEHVTAWRLRTKQRLVDLKGGKCERCGYDKYNGALEFHHHDPGQKEFSLNQGNTRAWGRLVEEVEKCSLLCANCHREVHEELRVTS